MVKNSLKSTVILLAGGKGRRMGGAIPKQFLPLQRKSVIEHSLKVFLEMEEVEEIIVVCDPDYRDIFEEYRRIKTINFADPGVERQDSVFNGLQKVSPNAQLVIIHDGARPMIDDLMVREVLEAAEEHGAALAAMPLKFTVKATDDQEVVGETIDRSRLWEAQTPQIVKQEILWRAFEHVHKNKLSVTDDVSMVESLGLPVKLVMGSSANIKVTTPEDFVMITALLKSRTLELVGV